VSTPVPYDYLIPGYGVHGPLVDGLLIARQLVEHNIPDYTWETYDPMAAECYGKIHNEYKTATLADIDRRIEYIKQVTR